MSIALAGNFVQYCLRVVCACLFAKSYPDSDVPRVRITNILVSRFILDLRGVYYKDTDFGGRTTTKVMSSIHFFPPAVIGNIGAPIDPDGATWAVGAGDEPEESHTEQEETEDPIAFGLPGMISHLNSV